MADSPTTTYNIGGEDMPFPDLADGRAIKNSATRFENAWGLPNKAAFCLATAMVDPALDRNQVDVKQPFGHLQAIQTPDGKFLLAHRTTVWTPTISGDGGNGRSRYEIQTYNGGTYRPWPIGRHHKPAIIDYHPASLSDMLEAVKLSAATIRSQDLITQIRRSPRGVWNPPVVVIARAYVTNDDGSVEERWFLHTIDGSTRAEACHELTDTAPEAPLLGSLAPLNHLRDSYERITKRFHSAPMARNTLHAARAATMPALVVVAVVEGDMVTPIKHGFPTVINDYVESVHVQPRPFTDVAQANVIGERFVLNLRDDDRLDADMADSILGRTPEIEGKPSVRAATLVHAVCDADNEQVVRDFVITDVGKYLTKVKRAKLIGPLVVRQFDEVAPSAERALMRAFTPELLIQTEWDISGAKSAVLRRKGIAEVNAGRFDSPVLAELMARGGPALCAAGLLLGDQESTVRAISSLRGSVEKVIEGLAKTVGGVNVLADAVAWADGEQTYRPRVFDVEGGLKKNADGDVVHYTAVWHDGNMGIRALAFTGGKIQSSSDTADGEEETPRSPDEAYLAKELKLIEELGLSTTLLRDMFALKDEQGRPVMARLGMRNAEVYETFPKQLTKLYNKYGKDDDPFATFPEDELPLDEDPDEDQDDEDEEEYDLDEENV
ncbi:hypothetical protein NQK81_12855 [Amycolatopsis roodepoortensis]|uniref:hypothetical protein n=1 Tax=Amycolatopsis roodepoortensis TaxID=700274 RepID=UPI00214C1D0E|nr:hypothetical protein [Amycolatopsis roodepoortensis]UUV34294.1 hypothetical protein NQK81_12855 [Amycolatopsis roodepoortensis]